MQTWVIVIVFGVPVFIAVAASIIKAIKDDIKLRKENREVKSEIEFLQKKQLCLNIKRLKSRN